MPGICLYLKITIRVYTHKHSIANSNVFVKSCRAILYNVKYKQFYSDSFQDDISHEPDGPVVKSISAKPLSYVRVAPPPILTA